jgi:hypothetical protein
MAAADSNRFSAAGSALGYLAQVEYALLIALQRMDNDDSFRLSLETIDDITFEVSGQPRELWQSKHHVGRQGSLGDASPDLWKTLHNWIETSDTDSACFLLTTVAAPPNSAARLLGPAPKGRDVIMARKNSMRSRGPQATRLRPSTTQSTSHSMTNSECHCSNGSSCLTKPSLQKTSQIASLLLFERPPSRNDASRLSIDFEDGGMAGR